MALRPARFAWRHQTEYFNHLTYLSFLEEVLLPSFYRRGHRVYLIQDNASYHTHPEVMAWFDRQSRRLAVFALPKYSPEFNARSGSGITPARRAPTTVSGAQNWSE